MTVPDGRLKGILQTLGPGLIMAGAAIGGSHLVQSTRAGADYGFALVWIIILANLFKYPFFEYGPRYTVATGESLLHGYRRVGTWALAVFLVFTFCTMFIIVAALTTVTAGLSGQILGIQLDPGILSVFILALCVAILCVGKYPLLDKLIKLIVCVLALSTISAVIALLLHGIPARLDTPAPALWTVTGVSFMVALMGWMPSIVDISVWHSLWTLERREQTGHTPTLGEARIDFNLGYLGTAFLALVFLTLGALVMFGSGASFPDNTVQFAGQLVSLYTTSLGAWARPLILISAFTTMFSTTLVVTDAYPRVLRGVYEIITAGKKTAVSGQTIYFGSMIVIVIVALIIVNLFQSRTKTMIDAATTLSFLTTPVLAFINYRAVTGPHMPEHARPGMAMRALSWAGILFWTAFALLFVYIRFLR